jgi:ribosome-associated translation inhibitor RaiA
MQVQINTDSSIEGREQLATELRIVVEDTLSRFSDHITRVEVHLSDENRDKGGSDDKRCVMEAHLKGHPPIVVTDQAATVGQAVHGAASKLKKAIESSLGRLRDHQRIRTDA